MATATTAFNPAMSISVSGSVPNTGIGWSITLLDS